MAGHVSGTTSHAGARGATGLAFAGGLLAFAAVMMIVGGLLSLFQGIAAIAEDEVFVATRNYAFAFDLTGWGWIHLVLGVVVAFAGIALVTGATWARAVGVGLAVLLMVSNFLYLPYQPVWAMLLIALNAFVIWALCVAPRRSDA